MTPAVAVLGGWGARGSPAKSRGQRSPASRSAPPLPPPEPFVVTLTRAAGASAGARELEGGYGTRLAQSGGRCLDQTGLSGRVIAGSRRGDPGALFVQLSLPFVGSGGDRGPGGGEARGSEAGPRILESPEWGGPKLRGGVRRFPLGWTGQGAPGGRYVRGARGARGGETSGSGSASSGLAACTDQKPARSVLL